MTSPEATRRPGYAPSTAAVGRRGRRTRDRILTCTAELFVANGIHGTSIDAIAKAAGGSRATVYQYFESKDEIYVELAEACRSTVLDHARSLGRLGPDAAGLAELRRWLGRWWELSDDYALTFLNFPGVGTIGGTAEADAEAATATYTALVADKLAAAGITGIEPGHAAAALLRLAHMLNLRQFRGMFGLTDEQRTLDSLSIALQRLLFPGTPRAVLGTIGDAAPRDAETPAAISVPDEPHAARVSPLRQDILAAASSLFDRSGFYSVSMDEIAATAEVSRATLYRHFSTKMAILEELSEWSVLESSRLSAELSAIAAAPTAGELHSWLSRYVHFHRTYIGVIRAWYDGAVQQLEGDSVARGMGTLRQAALTLLQRCDLPPNVDLSVAAAIFLAALGRLTEHLVVHDDDGNDYEAAGFILLVLQRALLGPTIESQPSAT